MVMDTLKKSIGNDADAVYEKGTVKMTIPRRLSEGETRMVDKSYDTISNLYGGNEPIKEYLLKYALKSILCSENAWANLSLPIMQSFRSASDRETRNKSYLALEGLVIGMVHVYEVRHDIHKGTNIAMYIDYATRPLGYDAISGIIDRNFAYKIIRRAYSKR
jgi:hypothetical protein